MSDISRGPGWRLAKDGSWYHPAQHHAPAIRARYDRCINPGGDFTAFLLVVGLLIIVIAIGALL